MSNTRTFRRTGGLRPGRSVFDLSYEKKFTCEMGQLIPICCDEVVPGDVWTIGSEILVRAMPLIAPIMHEINIYTHWFFVPYRLLWNEWENFITGGRTGNEAPELPRWPNLPRPEGSVADYMGIPPNVSCVGKEPLDFPRRAYYLTFINYYTDPNLTSDADLDVNNIGVNSAQNLYNRCWEKDYFTSALPWQQRGTAPALPISGITNAEFLGSIAGGYTTNEIGFGQLSGQLPPGGLTLAGSGSVDGLRQWLNNNEVDLSQAATFDVSDLRLAFQIQKWMERNARAGYRYTEFLRSHFGVSPKDERLDRPEYIGGSKKPLMVSEVLQTSSTDSVTPQGNMAGHGISVSGTMIGTYRVKEYGLILGLMSIMPRTAYSQGIDRQWLRETKYDFYFPEFANLSEQAIYQAEIMASNSEAENNRIFGYQGRYDEMRFKRNMICGKMRSDFEHWHLGRKFSAENPPRLNYSFVRCVPDKRIFEVTTEPGFVVTAGNLIRAVRPMPIMSQPGLIDHN